MQYTHTHTPSALPKLRREKNISIFSKRISIFGMLKNINFNNKDSDNDFFSLEKKTKDMTKISTSSRHHKHHWLVIFFYFYFFLFHSIQVTKLPSNS